MRVIGYRVGEGEPRPCPAQKAVLADFAAATALPCVLCAPYFNSVIPAKTLWVLPVKRVPRRPIPMSTGTGV